MQRMQNIYGKINHQKTKGARLRYLKLYQQRLHHFLKLGYNPFEDNSELHTKLTNERKLEDSAAKSDIGFLKDGKSLPTDSNENQQQNQRDSTSVDQKSTAKSTESTSIEQKSTVKSTESTESTAKSTESTSVDQKSTVSNNIQQQNQQLFATNQQQINLLINQVKSLADIVKDVIKNDSIANQDSSSLKNIKKHPNNNKVKKVKSSDDKNRKTIEEAFEFAIQLKSKEVKESTIKDYRGKVDKLITWLKENLPEKVFIDELNRKDLLDFLNSIQLKTSPRTRNNYRSDLSSLFQVLRNNELVGENYFLSINILKAKPNKHRRYSAQQQEVIFKYLEKEDPLLLLYIKFIFYGFLRPLEVSRLKIRDIDIENKQLRFQSKTKHSKIKIIPEILLQSIPDLRSLKEEDYLFTPEQIGGAWSALAVNRRDHFTKRFSRVVKKKFKLDANYTLYSFRHTAITKLYNKLKKDSTDYIAKGKLMPITGHQTMEALEKYLRDIDADLPDDYSKLFNQN